MKIKLIILSFLLVSCAKFKTIGKVTHSFNSQTQKIIWLQIAGFEMEHLALVRFARPNSSIPMALEKSSCLGNMWNYNLFDLRPNAAEGFMSQMTGNMNIKGTCEDLKKNTLWSMLKDFGFKTTILESGVDKSSSITNYEKCEKFSSFLDGASLVKMQKKRNQDSKLFHFQEKQILENAKVYYDKSCQRGKCHSSFYANVKSLWEDQFLKNEKSILIIRDFSYLEKLKNGDTEGAQELLADIERLYSLFINSNNGNTLLLLTSSESLKLKYPKQGKAWLGYINNRNNISRRSSLISNALAYGAKSENFCGVYNESEVLERILWAPEDNKPFKNIFINQ